MTFYYILTLLDNHSAEFCPLWTGHWKTLCTSQATPLVCLYCLFLVDCWLAENLTYPLSLVNGLTGALPFLMTYFTWCNVLWVVACVQIPFPLKAEYINSFCTYSEVRVFIFPLMGVCFPSISWLLHIVLLGTQVCKYLCGNHWGLSCGSVNLGDDDDDFNTESGSVVHANLQLIVSAEGRAYRCAPHVQVADANRRGIQQWNPSD